MKIERLPIFGLAIVLLTPQAWVQVVVGCWSFSIERTYAVYSHVREKTSAPYEGLFSTREQVIYGVLWVVAILLAAAVIFGSMERMP